MTWICGPHYFFYWTALGEAVRLGSGGGICLSLSVSCTPNPNSKDLRVFFCIYILRSIFRSKKEWEIDSGNYSTPSIGKERLRRATTLHYVTAEASCNKVRPESGFALELLFDLSKTTTKNPTYLGLLVFSVCSGDNASALLSRDKWDDPCKMLWTPLRKFSIIVTGQILLQKIPYKRKEKKKVQQRLCVEKDFQTPASGLLIKSNIWHISVQLKNLDHLLEIIIKKSTDFIPLEGCWGRNAEYWGNIINSTLTDFATVVYCEPLWKEERDDYSIWFLHFVFIFVLNTFVISYCLTIF